MSEEPTIEQLDRERRGEQPAREIAINDATTADFDAAQRGEVVITNPDDDDRSDES